MKTIKYLASALLIAGLGACSSDDVTVSNAGQPQWDVNGKGYISLNINLPQEKSNRANDKFDDGEASEYAIHNAKLLLYKGASAAAATYAATYTLNTTGFNGVTDDPNQVTASGVVVQKIDKIALNEGENLYALVVLNDNNQVPEKAELSKDAQQLTVDQLTKYGIFMTNAPLYTAPGGTNEEPKGELQTLVPVDVKAIKSTPEEAALVPAANVFVERAVGKVEVKTADFKLANVHNPLMKEDAFKVLGWVLDQTNNKSFYVRNMDGANWWTLKAAANGDYRFVGTAPVKNRTNLYRTYWANDPNYNAEVVEGDLTTKAMQQLQESDFTAVGKYVYCLENTTNREKMQSKNLTRVVVGVAFDINPDKPGYEDFYILNGNSSVYYDEQGVTNEVKRQIMNAILPDLSQYLTAGTMTADNLAFAFMQKGMHEGYRIVDGNTLKIRAGSDWAYVEGGEAKLKAKMLEVIGNVNHNMTIAYYKGGVNYYPVYIKHFGDDQTPWTDNGTGKAYDSDDNYLGRYGVLRNNWYEVNVKSVRNFGEPEVPEGTIDTPDPTDSFMSVEINVLSWAKREQDADL